MKLELVTLTGVKYQEEAYEVILPTVDGIIAVFAGHMPLVTLATPGVISVRRKRSDSDDQMDHFATNGGTVEVGGDTVRLLVDEADHADEIHEEEAKKALERAHQLKADAKDKLELDTAQSLIDRQAVRLKVAGLRRHRRKA